MSIQHKVKCITLLAVLFLGKRFRKAFEVRERIITFVLQIHIKYTDIH